MTNISLKQFILDRGADTSSGIRYFAPDGLSISVRDLVRSLSGHPLSWRPTSRLAKAVNTAGFLYDPGQDIIYSTLEPLQRLGGYAYGYDAAAIAMDAIIDCEPIFFEFEDKYWMIELWKGQYGLETGVEIGIYNRPKGSHSDIYDLLDMTVGSCDTSYPVRQLLNHFNRERMIS